jgi:type IV pilus biogenesis protein CpaD/CtpE
VKRRVLLAGVATSLAGCASLASRTLSETSSSASVSVVEPEEPHPDCEVRVDVDVAAGEFVTVAQVDDVGVADSTTTGTSGVVVRPAFQGSTLSVVAVDAESGETSTLFRGVVSGVDADECGVSEA